MKRCRTCGKKLKGKEQVFCKTCKRFHKHNYSKEELEWLLHEYEQWEDDKND